MFLKPPLNTLKVYFLHMYGKVDLQGPNNCFTVSINIWRADIMLENDNSNMSESNSDLSCSHIFGSFLFSLDCCCIVRISAITCDHNCKSCPFTFIQAMSAM